jgi:Rps23 Pro-64 3,4-dihydroxylase Tpa1-like proline 4-hydroxylase
MLSSNHGAPETDSAITVELLNKSKRAKTEMRLEDVICSNVLTSQDVWKRQFDESRPFQHGVLNDLFKADFLEKVLLEIKDNSKVTFKESDLFKFYQSIDLANLDASSDLARAMPHVMQLRQVLYSDQWRTFIEQITGIEENTLSEQVDCACNCHVSGCHLLCHDDVIGTRKISYILYLTEDDWMADEGGALELYDKDADRLPNAAPAKCLLPTRNSMAFFVVEPGTSFHAVQEVVGDRPRLSLQGWYHAKDPPINMEEATLQQLKCAIRTGAGSEIAYAPFASNQLTQAAALNTIDSVQLSDFDKNYLSRFMDETYLKPEALREMRDRFEEDSSIQLQSFLNDTYLANIQWQETGLDVTDKGYYVQGTTHSWKLVGPPHMQRYLEFNKESTNSNNKQDALGGVLYDIRKDVLQSESFARFLSLITSLQPVAYRGRIRRFRPGLDYTVAHYGLMTEQSVLDATLCFVAGEGKDDQAVLSEDDGDESNDSEQQHSKDMNDADVAWQSGDVGGFECYIAVDEEDKEAADEYNQDNDTELLSVSAANNTLSLVFRDPGTMRFVKYLSKKAPSSRWDISMEYQIQESGDDPKIYSNLYC